MSGSFVIHGEAEELDKVCMLPTPDRVCFPVGRNSTSRKNVVVFEWVTFGIGRRLSLFAEVNQLLMCI